MVCPNYSRKEKGSHCSYYGELTDEKSKECCGDYTGCYSKTLTCEERENENQNSQRRLETPKNLESSLDLQDSFPRLEI